MCNSYLTFKIFKSLYKFSALLFFLPRRKLKKEIGNFLRVSVNAPGYLGLLLAKLGLLLVLPFTSVIRQPRRGMCYPAGTVKLVKWVI